MPNWKFWEKTEVTPVVPEPTTPSGRFNLKPRTDLPVPDAGWDSGEAERYRKLLTRRERVMFDVQQAETALEADNDWHERIALIDAALLAIDQDRRRLSAERESPGSPLPQTPVERIAFVAESPQSVTFSIGAERFEYTEPLDWAERGFQLARVDFERTSGDPGALVPFDVSPAERLDLGNHLAQALFVFASDVRNRSLDNAPIPEKITLADLAPPDVENGGWRDWLGHSSVAQAQANELRILDEETARLQAERARELSEQEKWADRLPIARRRLVEVEAELAAIGNSS